MGGHAGKTPVQVWLDDGELAELDAARKELGGMPRTSLVRMALIRELRRLRRERDAEAATPDTAALRRR